jgi:hypothetical protein
MTRKTRKTWYSLDALAVATGAARLPIRVGHLATAAILAHRQLVPLCVSPAGNISFVYEVLLTKNINREHKFR